MTAAAALAAVTIAYSAIALYASSDVRLHASDELQLVVRVLAKVGAFAIGFYLGRRDRALQLRQEELRSAREQQVYAVTPPESLTVCRCCATGYNGRATRVCPNCLQPAGV